MFYRIAVTIAVVLVCVFAATRTQEAGQPTPAQHSTPTNEEPNMKGLQIN